MTEFKSEDAKQKRKKGSPTIRPVAILDLETDPFLSGRIPHPFVAGIYFPATDKFLYFWGDDCAIRSFEYLASLTTRHIIYAHNGGKFDWLFYSEWLNGKIKMINGRIVSADLAGHEIRDSYSIMPFPLRDYKKDDIDYKLMERDKRDANREIILRYLGSDCRYLARLIVRFHELFGQKYLTIGSTAMSEIRARHETSRTNIQFDRIFRPTFFYGGRVECFKTGLIRGKISVYDVNSMYPAVMRNERHPNGSDYIVGRRITDDTCFVTCEGENHGAFPSRSATGGLSFTKRNGEFHTSIFEYRAGVDTGTFRPSSIIRTYDFPVRDSFADFVNYFHDKGTEAKMVGDDDIVLFYKYIRNSGYGKFAQNPANFHDWILAPIRQRPREVCGHCKGTGNCYERCYKCQALNDYAPVLGSQCMFCLGSGQRWMLSEFNDLMGPNAPMLWKARTFQQSYNNVATGASITGAARAILLRGLQACDEPIYCDTDSVMTIGEFHGEIDKYRLGAWKYEGTGCLAAIAGKKMYALFTDQRPTLSDEQRRKSPWMEDEIRYQGQSLWCIKKAHKGARLSPREIFDVARGWTIEKSNDAPSFGLFRDPIFVTRNIRMTAKMGE